MILASILTAWTLGSGEFGLRSPSRHLLASVSVCWVFAFIYDDKSAHMQSHRFDDPAESEPTWYLMEDNDGLDRARVEQDFEVMWSALDEFTGASPRLAGTDFLGGEELERFDLFVPGSAYTEGRDVTIRGVGMIDPQDGVDSSFWFADEFGAPAVIDVPVAARSWNEFTSTSRD